MTTDRPFEIGLFTFGEITADPATGRPIDPAVRLREFIDLAVLADQAGLDVFGVGEHHRPDFAIASPPVVLAELDDGLDDAGRRGDPQRLEKGPGQRSGPPIGVRRGRPRSKSLTERDRARARVLAHAALSGAEPLGHHAVTNRASALLDG